MDTSELHRMIDFVAHNSMAVLTSLDENSKPWGSAVYVGVDNHFNLYFTTKSQTQKSKNIKSNPEVSVVIINEPKQETIQLQGVAEVITNAAEAQAASHAIGSVSIKSEDWLPPIAKLHAGDYELFKITVSYSVLRLFGDRRSGQRPQEFIYRT